MKNGNYRRVGIYLKLLVIPSSIYAQEPVVLFQKQRNLHESIRINQEFESSYKVEMDAIASIRNDKVWAETIYLLWVRTNVSHRRPPLPLRLRRGTGPWKERFFSPWWDCQSKTNLMALQGSHPHRRWGEHHLVWRGDDTSGRIEV